MCDSTLSNLLALHGLRRLGDCPDGDATITLIGPDEPRFWNIFQTSSEYQDGAPDPMDRWSRRIIENITDNIAAEAIFPFGGPPFAPFFTWAKQSGRFWASPIGFLVHDDAGLFVSFRGALRWNAAPELRSTRKPCDICPQKPCASACPVGAFDNGYDVTACKAHVTSDNGVDCRISGCLARRACPIGQGRRIQQQSKFHMQAFL